MLLIKYRRPLLHYLEKKHTVTVHAFTDASGKAYASAIYCHYESVGGKKTVKHIGSRTQLASLKAVSITQLKLRQVGSGMSVV